MKRLSRIIRSLVPVLAGVLSFSSCTIEDWMDSPTPGLLPGDGSAEISFMARIPQAPAVSTRADVPETEPGTPVENRIDDIYVLVFQTTGSQELVYKSKGKNLVFSGTDNNTVKFKATLPVGKAYNFMVLANAETLLGGINITEPAKTRADVEAILQQAATSGSTYLPWSGSIPMWHEQQMTLSASSTPKAFKLMRMMARIQVSYNPGAGTDNYFKLTNVRYYNYNTAGKLVPDPDKLDIFPEPQGGYFATSPTLPTDPGTQLDGFLSYTATADACKNKIYVFEAANRGKYSDGNGNWIENPCLVVGGVYDTDKDGNYDEEATTWYRIDFIRDANTTGETWLSILRNFTYNVVVTSVSGQGYADPEVALKSAPMNISAGVMDWNDGRMDNVIFDGTAYLSVDKHELLFERHAVNQELADGSNVLLIKTDYTVNGFPANSGWKAEYYTDSLGKIPMTDPWLELMPGSGPPTGDPDDPAARTYFKFSANETTANREAWVYIVAGRLRYRVHVRQRLLSLDLYEVKNSVDVPKDSMLFVIPRRSSDRVPITRQFKVVWTPIADDVDTGNHSPAAWNPFDPAWITGTPTHTLPGPGASGTITGGSGTQLYTVTAPAVTSEELNLDPFYEKESTYTFKIDNGQPGDPGYDYVEKSIQLRQIYYNIIVDSYKYRLDGGTSTLTVRSNTEWEITNVEEWLYNQDPDTLATPYPTPIMLNLKTYDNLKVGTTGGPNVNGEALAFTTVNNESGVHKGKWGTVYVTFHSPTGKFEDLRVPLPFPPATRLLMGIGYHDPTYATNVAITTHWHNNSAFKMLTSPYNFGSMDESTYKVEGFRVIGHNAQGLPNGDPDGLLAERNWHPNSMRDWLNNENPDVIVIANYEGDTYGTRYTANEIRLLDEYVDNGGALILMVSGLRTYSSQISEFLTALLDKTGPSFTHSTNGTGATASNTDIKQWVGAPESGTYYLLNDVEDPILKGPFGDVRGMYWGSHYHSAGIKTSLIADQTIPLSGGTEQSGANNNHGNSNYTTIFRHKTKNLVWIGCDGFAATSYPLWQQSTTYAGFAPFYAEQRYFRPAARTNWKEQGSAASTPTVSGYNSVVLANAVAWALSVTNHMPPSGGYQNQ